MKKSEIDINSFLLDINKAFAMIKKIEENNIEDLDLKKMKKDAINLKEKIKKDYLDNLDIEK